MHFCSWQASCILTIDLQRLSIRDLTKFAKSNIFNNINLIKKALLRFIWDIQYFQD
jgi:hypothetical protein